MKIVKYFFISVGCCMVLGAGALGALYGVIADQLPDVAMLRDVQLQIPLQVYTLDGYQIAQFGEKQRIPLTLEQMPPLLTQAFLAIEDSRFYSHYGVDPLGILRALWVDATAGRTKQGASTITQQLARNFFLDSERSLLRKIKEAILAIQIERNFSKEKIFELYLNKIYFGQRAYGVGAAAQIYFGKRIEQLDLGEMALLAGLPKAPSTLNPLHSLTRATNRRNLVLCQMMEKGYISQEDYQQARQTSVVARYHRIKNQVDAPHLAEMVRQEMVRRFGEAAYTNGYRVYTTITHPLQEHAQQAVQKNLLAYDRRHGYRGPSAVLWQPESPPWPRQNIQTHLSTQARCGPLQPAVIVKVEQQQAEAILADGSPIVLPWSGIQWARPFIDDRHQGRAPRQVNEVVATGEQVWVVQGEQHWWLSQLPQVDSALVAIHPDNGAIKALIGGFNFTSSAFNRITQSIRQSGSSIKPFVYAAALEKGLTLATLLNDLPITRWDTGAGKAWRPKNALPIYDGPLRLRVGLGRSKNVMVVRALRAIGVNFAADYLQRFGVPAANIKRTESLALGSTVVTPLQMVRGYAVFANGGYLVDPYFIDKIVDAQGHTVYRANPKVVCRDCQLPVIYGPTSKADVLLQHPPLLTDENAPAHEEGEGDDQVNDGSALLTLPRVEWITPLSATEAATAVETQRYAPPIISKSVAFLIKDALTSAIWGEPHGNWVGTGWRARSTVKRRDIGGKTGTTNAVKDAWFCGFGPEIVTTVWIGFDNYQRELGESLPDPRLDQLQMTGPEGGAKSAQPAWNSFMQKALAGIPEEPVCIPEGITTAQIDLKTGQLTDETSQSSRTEYFISGTEPTQKSPPEVGTLLFEQGEQQELF